LVTLLLNYAQRGGIAVSWLTYPDFFQNAGNLWLRLSYDVALKSFVFLLVVCLLYHAFRRFPSAFRHLLLSAGLGWLFLLPGALLLGPTWSVPFLHTPFLMRSGSNASSGPLSSETLALGLAGIWFIGFAIVILRLLAGLWIVRSLIRESVPVDDISWSRAVAKCSREVGLNRPIRLLTNHRLGAAICVGTVRAAILLPVSALDWPDEQRDTILRHEIGHIKRHDNITNVLALVVCAVYWFNPLVWWAADRLRICREAACDDLVLESGTRPSRYVAYLLQASSPQGTNPLSIVLSQISALKKRVLTILDPEVNRRKVQPVHTATCLALTAGMLASLAALEPWIIPPFRAGIGGEVSRIESTNSRLASDLSNWWRSVFQGNSGLSAGSFLGFEGGGQDSERRTAPSEPRPGSASTVGEAGALPINAERSSRSGFVSGSGSFQWDPTNPASPFYARGAILSSGPAADPNGDPPPQGESPDTEVPDLVMERLDIETADGVQSVAADINQDGSVVGASIDAGGESQPFIWDKSKGFSTLPCPSEDCQATKINNPGQVLIAAGDKANYLWSPDEDTILNIGTLGGESTRALQLNDRGQVAGASQTSFGTQSAFVWSPETGMIDLGGSTVVALNNRGQVVAWAGAYSFFWDPETNNFRRIGELDVRARPTDMNDHAEVVGSAQFVKDSRPQAFYWNPSDGLVLLDFPVNTVASCAVQIDDAGEVMALAVDEKGEEQVFTWRRGQEVRAVSVPDALRPHVDWEQLSSATSSISLIGSNLPSANLAEDLSKVSFASKQEPQVVAQPIKMNRRGQIAGNLVNVAESEVRAVIWELRFPKMEKAIAEILSEIPAGEKEQALKQLLDSALQDLRTNQYRAAALNLITFLDELPKLGPTIPEQTRTRWTQTVWHSLDRLSDFTNLK